MEQVSKKSVNYRPAADEKRSCSTCDMSHFDKGVTGTCDKVEGRIIRSAVCNDWEGK